MLILSRKREESIMIGDDVEILLVGIRRDKRDVSEDRARLGITAPKHIPVHRREIYDAIQREKAQKIETAERIECQSMETSLVETEIRAYFSCCGAYGERIAVQEAYREVSSTGRKLKCERLDSAGYCHLDLKNTSNKCPHNIERLV